MQIFVIDKIQASKLTTRKELNKFLKISTKLMIWSRLLYYRNSKFESSLVKYFWSSTSLFQRNGM